MGQGARGTRAASLDNKYARADLGGVTFAALLIDRRLRGQRIRLATGPGN